jgi:hypothetical protein
MLVVLAINALWLVSRYSLIGILRNNYDASMMLEQWYLNKNSDCNNYAIKPMCVMGQWTLLPNWPIHMLIRNPRMLYFMVIYCNLNLRPSGTYFLFPLIITIIYKLLNGY